MQDSHAPQERPSSSHKESGSAQGATNSNGHSGSAPFPGSTPQAMDWPEYERWLNAHRQYIDVQVEEVRLTWMRGAADALLQERKVDRRLKILKHCLIALGVVTAVGLSVASFSVIPMFFSLSLLAGASVGLRQLAKWLRHGSTWDRREGDP